MWAGGEEDPNAGLEHRIVNQNLSFIAGMKTKHKLSNGTEYRILNTEILKHGNTQA